MWILNIKNYVIMMINGVPKSIGSHSSDVRAFKMGCFKNHCEFFSNIRLNHFVCASIAVDAETM